ncbi:PREDICTED: FKBP12-interacting protein of 37 kDa isoform X2 [Camelina sativa]|uniref:FKBP12-interacting protein of 37 kDa isoform X1 n=1 Tax=Camelina sativa TaxID=90675 RepID=A0ABM0ZHT7_CAMSA|nr:PREDICTED: FKBP12-interacting protein of 37 kDa isoform X1 [Camelina sativa]XP_010515934.1 PREDICTED: FKBP12-interacting protein of 37 kDa isoform X2 [Camelina sativa]
MEFSLQDDDFGGDYSAAANASRASGNKRSFGDLEDDEDDIFGSKKGRTKVEEAAPGVATGMILSLRESLQNCKDDLASCQNELESAKTEIQKWKSAFQNESFVPAGKSPEPRFLIDYIQNLKSSERSWKEQLEIAKRKEASCIVQYAKREQEMAELKSAIRDLKSQLKPASMQARRLLLDPAIHEEFSRLKNLVGEKDKKIKELQDENAALAFTTQGKMGKMLMAKCKTLQEENEEIGHQAAEGKIHELAMKLTLQKSQNAELRSQFEGLFKHMDELTNDVERSNETVIILQEKLEEKEKEIERVKKGMEIVVPDVVAGDNKNDEVVEIDEDAKEIDGGE